MRRRLVLILAFAAVVGFVASYLVYRVTVQVQATAAPDSTVPVVVAAANMALGEQITSKHVKLTRWPKASVPPAALKTVEEAEGRVVRSSIIVGEPLLEGKLAPNVGGRAGIMPILVPEGQRAVTIMVDAAIRETGFILPNSAVDVLVSTNQTGSGEKIAKVILQDVTVLASGQTIELRDNKPVTMTTVTLALTPDQTERLTLAQTEGKLFFVTRNLNDRAIVRTRGVTKSSLLSDAAAAPSKRTGGAQRPKPRPSAAAAAPVLPPPVIESVSVSVLKGTKISEHEFVRKGPNEWVEKGAGGGR